MNPQDNILKTSFLRYADNDYKLNKNNNLNYQEIQDFSNLFDQIVNQLDMVQMDGYFFNSSFEHGIREQFDVLRFCEKSILNIELKSQLPMSGIDEVRNQLVRHKYMLELFDDLSVHVFTYVSQTNELYTLRDSDEQELIKVPISTLISYIDKNYSKENLLNRIDSTSMVVSPYTEPGKFLTHSYFLNNDQLSIRNKVLSDDSNLIILKGGPGSGKSLVLFDLAKKYKEQGKKVAVIFCAKLSNIYELNEIYDFDIISTNHNDFRKNETEFIDYDVLLIDEAQRMYSNHLDENAAPGKLEKMVKLTETIKIVFSIDHGQSTHKSEIDRNNQKFLEAQDHAPIYELKYKVRTEKNLGIFIQKMLNYKKKNLEVVDFNNVSITYFRSKEDAIQYSDFLKNESDYKLIEMNEYITASTRVKKRPKLNPKSTNLYDVYGQEYDNVAIILDEHFCYNAEGMLTGTYNGYYPYNQIRSFTQALTRVKRNLELIVVNNPNVYSTLQQIMTWKADKVNGPSYNYYNIGLHTNKNSLSKLIKYLDLKDENELISKIETQPNLKIDISVCDLYEHLKKQ